MDDQNFAFIVLVSRFLRTFLLIFKAGKKNHEYNIAEKLSIPTLPSTVQKCISIYLKNLIIYHADNR